MHNTIMYNKLIVNVKLSNCVFTDCTILENNSIFLAQYFQPIYIAFKNRLL